MLRVIEILLFLLPFIGWGLWLWTGRRHSQPLLWGTLAAMLVMVLAAAWLELTQAVPPDLTYVPPQMRDGQIVPGHAVRRPRP